MLPYIELKSKNELVKTNMLDFWIDMAVRQADSFGQVDDRLTAMIFLTDIWFNFSQYVDQKGDLSNTLIGIMRKFAREKSFSAKIVSISLMFRLLDRFAENKNSSAPVIYKSLIFTLIESSSEIALREHYLANFSSLFKTVPSIPISLLVEPLLKNMQLSKFEFKPFDFEFFKILSQHPKLNLAMALSLADLLSEILLNQPIFASSVINTLAEILYRFGMESDS